MKSFFFSIVAVLASLLGIHSQSVQSPVNAQTASISMQTSPLSTTVSARDASPIVTFPMVTDVLYPGKSYDITWQNEASNTAEYSVNLEIATGGSYFVIMPLGTVSSQKRSLAFTVPAGIVPRTNYQISFSIAPQLSDVVARSQGFTIK